MQETLDPSKSRISRRKFIAASLALGAGASFLKGGALPAQATTNTANDAVKHLVWVWQFSTDGTPDTLARTLRDHGLGMIMKTHDGTQWMKEYDTSPFAVSSPAQAAVLANYYEQEGVPFHAWCVLHGVDPIREAQMAAEVLAGGARSIFLDVEPHSGFWRGTASDAMRFGEELRRLQPNATVVVSIDPRPWMIGGIPLKEFASFSDEIALQQYWRTFDTSANYTRFAESGYPVPPDGVSPEFLLSLTEVLFSKFGKRISHTGQGDTENPDEWRRFIDLSRSMGSNYVSVWRYGVTPANVLAVLRDMPPPQPPAAPSVHVVQPGDTLGVIASAYGTSVEELMALNGLSDANYLYVGQELTLPGGSVIQATGLPQQDAPAATGGGGQDYTVQEGDTLYAIAGRFGTSVDSIVEANGLSNPDMLSIGQVLHIP